MGPSGHHRGIMSDKPKPAHGFGANVDPAVGKATQFKPGQSGCPGGRGKNKWITEIYREILEEPGGKELVKKAIIKAIKSGRMQGTFTIKEMTDRLEGKTPAPITVEFKGVFAQMTEAELEHYAASGEMPERLRKDETPWNHSITCPWAIPANTLSVPHNHAQPQEPCSKPESGDSPLSRIFCFGSDGCELGPRVVIVSHCVGLGCEHQCGFSSVGDGGLRGEHCLS
jgi:hypothetical protein